MGGAVLFHATLPRSKQSGEFKNNINNINNHVFTSDIFMNMKFIGTLMGI